MQSIWVWKTLNKTLTIEVVDADSSSRSDSYSDSELKDNGKSD